MRTKRFFVGIGACLLLGIPVLVAEPADDVPMPGLSQTRAALLEGEKPVRIVCFGDSVTGVYYHTGGRRAYADMLQLALKRVYPQATIDVINAGISGHATPDALARIEEDVLKHEPQLVTVMFGLNDITHVPISEYAANLVTIVEKCRAIGSEVLLCTPNAVFDSEDRPSTVLEKYVTAVLRVGSEQRVPVVDCYAAFQRVRSTNEFDFALLMSDEIHPNMDGHKLFAELLAAKIGGRTVTLDNVGYPEPALPKTRRLLGEKKPVKILAMPPYDVFIEPALRACVPSAQVEVTTWTVEGRDLNEIEAKAKNVRGMEMDLVVIAVPLTATAGSREDFVRAHSWIMNYALSFAHQEWDVVAIPPSVTKPDLTQAEAETDTLIRRLIHAQDLGTVLRAAGDSAPAATLLESWLLNELDPDSR